MSSDVARQPQWPPQEVLDAVVDGDTADAYAVPVIRNLLGNTHYVFASTLRGCVDATRALGVNPDLRTDPDLTRAAAEFIRFAGALVEPLGWTVQQKGTE